MAHELAQIIMHLYKLYTCNTSLRRLPSQHTEVLVRDPEYLRLVLSPYTCIHVGPHLCDDSGTS